MSDNITVTIDGLQVETQPGRLLIDVADENDIVIPRFCYHKKLSVAANCRMCLVEVEKAPKPMPACATQVMDGMVVQTRSNKSLAAQKSTMEFLLINHPLDCPVCDQGGECELQDVAMGFGEGVSKYSERKRVVRDKNIGPLIATDFTRCIHCTRCVRFGDEIAGMPELGATGRGEHTEIGTYIEKSIQSELSGNVIDVCPVGALTAKPSRYTARPWELTQHATVAAHDCVGSNMFVHSRRDEVIRVVPRENESINETWLSDRDRFSHTANASGSRITQPMVREGEQLKAVDWEVALNLVTEKLQATANRDASKIAALVSPQATLEEHYLIQKIIRGLGCSNIDHRLQQVDFSAQDREPVMPWLGRSLESLQSVDAALMVASNARHEQPLLSHRLRKAAMGGSKIASIGHLVGQYNYPLVADLGGSASELCGHLAAVAKALAGLTGKSLKPHAHKLCEGASVGSEHEAIATALQNGADSAVIVGVQAEGNPHCAMVRELSEAIATMSDSTLGYLSSSSNSSGACLAGVTPHRGVAGSVVDKAGENTAEILSSEHDVLLSFGVNPQLDSQLSGSLKDRNQTVISISSFDNDFNRNDADIVLPLATMLETSGTYVNIEGLWQSFEGCVSALEGSRPGWKILTALGQLLLPGDFDFENSRAVRDELKEQCRSLTLDNVTGIESADNKLPSNGKALQKIGIAVIYATDEMTRHAEPLQQTPLMSERAVAIISSAQASKSKLQDCEQVHIKQGDGTAILPLVISDEVADGCVFIPLGIDSVKNLSTAFGDIALERL